MIATKNKWCWPLFRGRIKVMLSLHHIHHWISRKPFEIDACFQRTTNRKWPMGYQMVMWLLTSRDPLRSNSWPQYAYSALSPKQLEMVVSNNCLLVDSLLWGSTVGYLSDCFVSCFHYILISGYPVSCLHIGTLVYVVTHVAVAVGLYGSKCFETKQLHAVVCTLSFLQWGEEMGWLKICSYVTAWRWTLYLHCLYCTCAVADEPINCCISWLA